MMVFGNKSEHSGTGVAFTRNPATGEAVFYGEYLEQVSAAWTLCDLVLYERTHKPTHNPPTNPNPQAEGEDVVSGVRTPHSLDFLKTNYPEIYAELDGYQKHLENHYRDVRALYWLVGVCLLCLAR